MMRLMQGMNGWVYIVFGKSKSLSDAQLIRMGDGDMFFRTRKEAVAAAKRQSLAVGKNGVVSNDGPNPFNSKSCACNKCVGKSSNRACGCSAKRPTPNASRNAACGCSGKRPSANAACGCSHPTRVAGIPRLGRRPS